MTYELNQRGRQEAPPEKAAPSPKQNAAGICGICGGEIGAGPNLIYMPVIKGKLREVRVCPFCFLKIVMGARG